MCSKDSLKQQIEKIFDSEIKFCYTHHASPSRSSLYSLRKKVLSLLANYEKTELQRKAKTVFKIRKMIDDWAKEYCIDKKCAGLLNCKLCLECEIGMRKGAYKDVLKLLEKNDVIDCVCIPIKQLEALWNEMPVPTLKVYHTHGDAQDFIQKTDAWVSKLRKLLEASKRKK